MNLRTATAVVILCASAFAQDDATRKPRDVYIAFRDTMEAAADGDAGALGRATELFDLSGLPQSDRAYVGARAARQLYAYLIRVARPDDFWENPKDDATAHAIGPIEFRRMKDGAWRFAGLMLERAEELQRDVEHLAPRAGSKVFSDRQSELREALPAWLRHRVFILEHWQWLGLLATILAGLVVAAIARLLVGVLSRVVARRQGVTLPAEGKSIMRPFGVLATAAFWMFGLPYLDLPPTVHVVLLLAARVVLMVGVVWSISRIVDLVGDIFRAKASRTPTKIDDLLVPLVRKALKVFIVALGIVWIADNLDMDVGALLAGLGIGGVALALAAKDTVENFFGAFAILADRPVQVGDWVVIGDIEGTVAEVGFRSTRVRTFYDSLITFPNAMLIRSAVDNFGNRKYRRLKTTIGVTYDTPPDKLEAFVEAIRELVRIHPYTRKDYYHVYFHGFGQSSLDILVYVFFHAPDWATELRERHRLHMDILRSANELGAEFAFPTRRRCRTRDRDCGRRSSRRCGRARPQATRARRG